MIANHSQQAIREVFWTVWDRETQCRMDSGSLPDLPPHETYSILMLAPCGGDPEVHLNFVDHNGLLWFRTDTVMSLEEWFDHPARAKWDDPERAWEKVWAPDEVQALSDRYRAELPEMPDPDEP